MSSGKSPLRLRYYFNGTVSAGVSVLFIFLMGFVFQGCVIHKHGSHSTHNKTRSHSHKNTHHHKHQSVQHQDSSQKHVKKLPSDEQHPSHTHQPPSHARAYEVSRGKPFTEGEHPSSNGQGHKVNQAKSHRDGEHPSSHGQGHTIDKGKPHKGDDHSSQQAKNDRPKGPKADKGKPIKGNDHPSSKGKHLKADAGKPNKGSDHPSSNAQDGKDHKKDRGKPNKEEKSPSVQPQNNDDNWTSNHKKDKGKPLWGNESPSTHAQLDKGNQGGPRKGHDRPSQSKGKSLNEDPITESSVPPQAVTHGKSDKGKSNSKRKQNDAIEQLLPSAKENIQIAKAEPGRGKGNTKGSTKANKKERGKHGQNTKAASTVNHQEPAPVMAPPKPTTIPASFAPAVFDNNQRSIIQNYYQKSGSSSSQKGKGKGKSSKGPKKNRTSSLAKNDILTQPAKPLPQSLESQLPTPPPNTKRVVHNQQILLVETRSNKVLDVIQLNN